MTRETEQTQSPQQSQQPQEPQPEGHVTIEYDHGGIPRWIAVMWLIYFVGMVVYIGANLIPDLQAWLQNPPVGHMSP